MTVENGENLAVAILFTLFFGGMFVPLFKHRMRERKTPQSPDSQS